MPHSKAVIYLHIVWATKCREPTLVPEVERMALRCIHGEAEKHGCTVVALNGMPDHVHLLVKVPATVSASTLAGQAKGVSSRMVSVEIPEMEHFRWQEGFHALSVSPKDVTTIADYIKAQKVRHKANDLWPSLESVGEPDNYQ